MRANLATQFNAILGQITQLAGDSGFNGVNLLNSAVSSNLTVTLNESGSSSVTVNAVNFTATGLALNVSNNNWTTSGDIALASTDLTAALTKLRSQAQSFGSNLSTVQISRTSPSP